MMTKEQIAEIERHLNRDDSDGPDDYSRNDCVELLAEVKRLRIGIQEIIDKEQCSLDCCGCLDAVQTTARALLQDR